VRALWCEHRKERERERLTSVYPDDRRRREVLEREGVLWSREWREKNAQEKEKKTDESSVSGGGADSLSTSASSGEVALSTSGDEALRTATMAWRNKRLSVSLTLNTFKVEENDDEFSLLKKFKDEDQRNEQSRSNSVGDEISDDGEEQLRLTEEKRMRSKLVRMEEMCVSRYRNVFHHMKGDIRKGIITLSEKPSYLRRRKARKSVRVRSLISANLGLRSGQQTERSLMTTQQASERYVLMRAEGLAITLRQVS
jgi:hypothetical protein